MMLAQMSTFEEARKALKISRTAIMHIVSYWVDKAVRETDLSEVERLSIDETSFRKGQSYVTVVNDNIKMSEIWKINLINIDYSLV